MKYPFVKQKDLKDCGVCSLLMIVKYYGGEISKEYLREITNTTKQGVTAYNLIEGSKKIGFNGVGVNGDITELKDNHIPCIAHVILKKSYQHFIVIYKIDHKKKKLIIADPNNSNITHMTFEEFNKITTNNYILLFPNKKIMCVEKNKFLLNVIHDNLKQFAPLIASVIFLSIVITIIQIIFSFQINILINYVINYKTHNNLLPLSLIFILLLFLKETSNFHRNNIINKLNHNFDKSIFLNVYNHILSLPYLYYKNRTTGEIVARMNDLVNIRDVISKSMITILIDSFLMIGSLIALFLISSKLTMLVIISLITLIISILLFNKPLENKITKTKKEAATVNSYLVETISGIETIKNQNITSTIKNKFLSKYYNYNTNSYKYNKMFINEEFIKSLIIGLLNLGIIILGSYLVVDDKITLASLITYIMLTNYLFSPIEAITGLILSIKEAKISYDRINELYEIQEENSNENNISKLDGDINTSNLTFSYNNRDLLLKDININIKKNSKVLIYGKSGSGKSTLAKTLSGILKVSNKKIYFDNKDINKYSTDTLNSDICYISGNETIFTDTIYNNIIISNKDNTDITKAINTSLVDDFVLNMPLTYNTLLEENGFNISSGQKQRIVLARSLLKNSSIYILDEALNQVDVEVERKILINLFNEYKDKTFIYISHRFHNQDLFDKKYKIEDGVSYEESI